MGLALYVLLRNAPFWLPGFLAAYWVARGRVAAWVPLALWLPVLLVSLAFVEAGRHGAVAVIILVGAALGGLMGLWQRRVNGGRPGS